MMRTVSQGQQSEPQSIQSTVSQGQQRAHPTMQATVSQGQQRVHPTIRAQRCSPLRLVLVPVQQHKWEVIAAASLMNMVTAD